MGSIFSELARVWFGIVIVLGMIVSALTCKIMALIPMSVATRQGICLMVVQFVWRVAIYSSPWINISPTPAVSPQWTAFIKDMEANDALASDARKPFFVIANHQSFLDTIQTIVFMPSRVTWFCRTYISSHLLKIPLLSTILKALGHFPVHFTAGEYGKFTVDREKMKLVQAQVDKYVKENNGILAFFPEGQMNKNPDKLCDFRYGGFKKAVEMDARIWSIVIYGNQDSWPIKAQLGGLPCKGKYDVRAFAPEGCKKKAAQLRESEPKEDTQDLTDDELLAKYARIEMQGMYDTMKASCTSGEKSD